MVLLLTSHSAKQRRKLLPRQGDGGSSGPDTAPTTAAAGRLSGRSLSLTPSSNLSSSSPSSALPLPSSHSLGGSGSLTVGDAGSGGDDGERVTPQRPQQPRRLIHTLDQLYDTWHEILQDLYRLHVHGMAARGLLEHIHVSKVRRRSLEWTHTHKHLCTHAYTSPTDSRAPSAHTRTHHQVMHVPPLHTRVHITN